MALAEQVGGNEAVEKPTWLGPNTAEIESLIRTTQNETISEEERREAFGTFAEQAYGNVLHLATRFTGSEDDGLEVTQETFRKAWKYLPTFRGDSPFNEWLYRVTANAASTFKTKKWTRKDHEEAVVFGLRSTTDPDEIIFDLPDAKPENDPEISLAETLLRDRVKAAMGNLTLKRQAVVTLRDVHDMSMKQIAEKLNITETSAKVTLHRARKQLKEILFEQQAS